MNRLEEIKNALESVKYDGSRFVILPEKELFISDIEWLIKAVYELKELARDINVNWDCDMDAHRYNTPCRACEAGKILEKFFKE